MLDYPGLYPYFDFILFGIAFGLLIFIVMRFLLKNSNLNAGLLILLTSGLLFLMGVFVDGYKGMTYAVMGLTMIPTAVLGTRNPFLWGGMALGELGYLFAHNYLYSLENNQFAAEALADSITFFPVMKMTSMNYSSV